AVLLKGELYLFGGLHAGPSKSLWALNLRERRWRPVAARKGAPPAPRQGHTMCWDGRSSLWVFGGQGADTSAADSSRTHQGVKIRTLAKRTCFNDFFEFNTATSEWHDHVQAGVCPTSRRGHTATLVVGRRMVHPTLSMTSAAPSSTHADTQHPAATESSDAAASPRSPSSPTLDRRGGDTGGGGRPGKMTRGRRRGADGWVGEGDHEREGKDCTSREMFVIGGAGTDPIRNMEVVHPQLWIFDFNARSWSCVEAREGGKGRSGSKGGGPGPPAVFDHTATLVGRKHIFVVGGAMVGTALNSEVYVLTLDSLQWSIFDPNPVGFPAPAIHGHTAVEDPVVPGRLIVFGGRGGSHWNTEVLTFATKKSLWSIAVCESCEETVQDDVTDGGNQLTSDAGEAQKSGVTRTGWGVAHSTHHAVTPAAATDGRKPSLTPVSLSRQQSSFKPLPNSRSNSLKNDNINDETSTSKGNVNVNSNNTDGEDNGNERSFGLAETTSSDLSSSQNQQQQQRQQQRQQHQLKQRQRRPPMPHQRNGHMCFAWDPRETALAGRGRGATFPDSSRDSAGRATSSKSPRPGSGKTGMLGARGGNGKEV
ncbi:unnamed protein product, partial [Sphacelaria rigidula]